jgi:hypothetical protein
MGRWAFGSRVWWIPAGASDDGGVEEEPGAETPDAGIEAAEGVEDAEAELSREAPEQAEEGARPTKDGANEEKDPLEEDRFALRWLGEHAPGSFVEWTEVQHPDFPDRTVEVGGFAPFARLNPPVSEIDSVLVRQQRFIVMLAGMLPSIALRDVEVVELSSGVYRVEARLVNDGYLPTLSALGERARWARRIRVEVVTNGQEIAAGDAVRLVGPLSGNGGHEKLHWVVTGDPGSRITLRASSPVAGEASQAVTLR